jgi:hypothetical protein
MTQKNQENRREHYRIIYPVSCRPKLVINNKQYDVIDVSERGVRFLHQGTCTLQPGSETRINITFHSGESLNIKCKVLRFNDTAAILSLLQEIPFEIIIEEQRYIKSTSLI